MQQISHKLDTKYLSAEDQKTKIEEFCLFSAVQPIYPHNSLPCQIKLGNLKSVSHKLLYCMLSPDNGEIYTVGIVLDRSVQLALAKQLKTNPNDDTTFNQSFSVDIKCRPTNYRVRLTEVVVGSEGIYAKAIPYKDRKLTEAELGFNVAAQIEQIQNLVNQISTMARYDRVEFFKEFDVKVFDKIDYDKPDTIDTVVYKIAMAFAASMNHYTKDSVTKLMQRLLETQTYLDRVQIIKHKLQDFHDAMDIVYKNMRQAENAMNRHQSIAMAKLATEYIRQAYLKDAPQTTYTYNQPSQPNPDQTHYVTDLNPNMQTGSNPIVKKFYGKLSLIDEPATKEKVRKEVDRFAAMDKQSSEHSKLHQYLDEIFSLPWRTHTPVQWDAQYAKEVLEKEIYGLEKVKQRIIEMIAVNRLKNSDEKSKGFILLLNGPPGVGKTSIAKSIGKCLKRTQRFISFAGVTDPHFFKGHRRTYVDSQAGVFIKELIKADTLNPVFILDEVDKMAHSSGGADPYYSLLEILNPEENHNFTDHYLDIPFDFSKVIFILTSNSTLPILEPLFNRLEIIEIPSYIEEEKVSICKEYLIPKVLEQNGISQQMLIYNDETIRKIIKAYCYYESGVRDVKRQFEKICRKLATEMVNAHPEIFANKAQVVVEEDPDITAINRKISVEEQSILIATQMQRIKPLDLTKDHNLDILQKYLGPPQFDAVAECRTNKKFPPGQVNILTVGGSIGNVMILECCYDNTEAEKKGQFTSSGNLKMVLQESLKLAKMNAAKYLVGDNLHAMQKSNIHVHFLNGSVPKDGPSAGTAICTALISLVSGKAIPSDLSMTGEISLNGNVCKIGKFFGKMVGGIQQKLIAAKTLGIKDVFIPKGNLGDVLDLPHMLLHGLNLFFVERYEQIYGLIFEDRLALFKAGEKLTDPDIVVVKDGYIVTQTQNSIYKNYELNESQQ